MGQQRSDYRMFDPVPGANDGDGAVDRAVAMRADQARLAAHHADRVEQARAAGQYGAMRQWMREYRRATTQCRLLGERIRRERADCAREAAQCDRAVVRLGSRSAVDISPAGEAA